MLWEVNRFLRVLILIACGPLLLPSWFCVCAHEVSASRTIDSPFVLTHDHDHHDHSHSFDQPRQQPAEESDDEHHSLDCSAHWEVVVTPIKLLDIFEMTTQIFCGLLPQEPPVFICYGLSDLLKQFPLRPPIYILNQTYLI